MTRTGSSIRLGHLEIAALDQDRRGDEYDGRGERQYQAAVVVDARRERRLAEPPEARQEPEGVEPGGKLVEAVHEVAHCGDSGGDRDRERAARPGGPDGDGKPPVEQSEQSDAEDSTSQTLEVEIESYERVGEREGRERDGHHHDQLEREGHALC